MTTYRSSNAGDRYQENRYFYYDHEQKHLEPVAEKRHECGCDHHCDCHCDHDCKDTCDYDYKSNSHFDKNYFNDSNDDATVVQDANQYSFMDQESAELIWVRESCDIEVNTTDTQVGVTLQAALQLAIALVIRVTIGDSERGDAVAQELIQFSDIDQVNKQKIYIYNTKDARVTTTDTDLAINIQLLLQVLVAIILLVDIL
ncbi:MULTISPECIES: spore coat protein [Oceanobacillus]|uniref:Spore coat protein X/V domain-containing protein n=1 Tax=Oceanobacillus kimchii TaxID=746691 RepID=A0ABQ5TFZ3_9BACI|nr:MULTISPECIES: spore coat protein [Oceanobacillus]MBT2652834.1 spore coat protein [Oceanobacillus sp. ISL-73]MCT1577378.1 spore coat protein [Oceanobacillus kimchii]MCT2136984.1 spore coat protein [Oceanobacillus kimchii]OEH53581.1 spore coat protein [Oceanobacillus sp. E9]GLO64905.1 hypothetical protein MACH08_06890 [Oceanobacillus kimchii]